MKWRRVEHLSEFDDTIITLGITPNRADALSHLGVSRELAALLDLNNALAHAVFERDGWITLMKKFYQLKMPTIVLVMRYE